MDASAGVEWVEMGFHYVWGALQFSFVVIGWEMIESSSCVTFHSSAVEIEEFSLRLKASSGLASDLLET